MNSYVFRRSLRYLCRSHGEALIIEPAIERVSFIGRLLEDYRRSFYVIFARIIFIINAAS